MAKLKLRERDLETATIAAATRDGYIRIVELESTRNRRTIRSWVGRSTADHSFGLPRGSKDLTSSPSVMSYL